MESRIKPDIDHMQEETNRRRVGNEEGDIIFTEEHKSTVMAGDTTPAREHGESAYLPDEIIIQILDYIYYQSAAQETLASCALVSRQWNSATTPLLYRSPLLYGHNFDPFVRAICPSINLHVRKSALAEFVKVLDMSSLVHQGSKSVTARLLGRLKAYLEEFVAPQASFAINCLPALAKCVRLKLLDLSLVSESPPLPDLFKAIGHLNRLKTLRLPRSSGFGVHHRSSSFPSFIWPPSLMNLCLSGGIDAHFLHGVVAFPTTLRSLTIEHCPNAKGFAVTHLLRTSVTPLKKLESLKIAHMPRLSSHALDDVLFLLPQISKLSVSVDYITPALFDEGHFHHLRDPYPMAAEDESVPNTPLVHSSLRTLELTNSGSPAGVEDKITPIDVMIAMDEGTLPSLRQVRVSRSLLWQSSSTREDVEALTDALQEGARCDWEKKEWLFSPDARAKEYRGDEWKAVAGVWLF